MAAGEEAAAMLRWRVVARSDGELELAAEGEITESSRFDDLAQRGGARVILDLEGVRRANSMGIRNLIELLTNLRRRGEVILERCSPPMVLQLGMLPELAQLVTVRSVVAPLECPACLEEDEVVVALRPGSRRPPVISHPCPGCGTTMELAEPEDRYFAFLG